MRPPEFWFRPPDRPGFAARLLGPLGWLVARAGAARMARAGHQAGVPVVCVGNLSIGGTGKTPVVMALADRLAAVDRRPIVVSRGYGGRLVGPVRVDPGHHSAADVGDEPLLLSAFAPVIVARARDAGVQLAEAEGAGIILLDDGFQNPSVQKSLSLVVIDAEIGFGNGRVMPAGPLREPWQQGLARADLVILIGPEPARRGFLSTYGAALGAPVQQAVLAPLVTGMAWSGARVLAFAGIGRPDKFFATLRALGADIAAAVSLDDHQPLKRALLQRLEADATARSAVLVTTEKDAVRLPDAYRHKVLTLPVRLQLTGEDILGPALDALGQPPSRGAQGSSPVSTS